MGVIENGFHDKKDLSPNVCALYTEDEYRCNGIAGHLLEMTVNDLRAKGIIPVYLVTDHAGFMKDMTAVSLYGTGERRVGNDKDVYLSSDKSQYVY